MKRILTLLLVVSLIFGSMGSAAAVSTNWQGIDGDGESLDGAVEVNNGTVSIADATEEIELTVNASDDNETVEVSVDGDVASVPDSDRYENGSYITEVENGTTETVTLELRDDVEDTEEAVVVGSDSYRFVPAGGTSFSAFDSVPFFGDSDAGVYLFYALAVGGILLAGVAIYLLWDQDTLNPGQRAAGYLSISIGAIGSVLSEYWWAVLGVFVVLLAAVLWLYTRDDSIGASGTMYMD